MKQYEAVIEALRQYGGYATHGQLSTQRFKFSAANGGLRLLLERTSHRQTCPGYFFQDPASLWGLSEQREEIAKKPLLGR